MRESKRAGKSAGAEKAEDNSILRRDWNLTGFRKSYPPAIQTYQQNYLLFANWSDNPNRMPSSPSPNHTTSEDLLATEVKFQFSLKSEILKWDTDFPVFDKYRLWFAYTQQSYWQFYNTKDSRPFRDNNYEPEIILTLGRPDDAAFLKPLKLVNIGLEHQSNGESDPLSRSWNRIYGQADFRIRQVHGVRARVVAHPRTPRQRRQSQYSGIRRPRRSCRALGGQRHVGVPAAAR